MHENPPHAEGSPCVHCGLCLEACPTYRLSGIEAESPRGRLYLMNALTRRRASPDAATTRHLDSCLGCLACETACPSGVAYGRHIERIRPQLRRVHGSPVRRALRGLAYRALRSAGWQRLAVEAATMLDALGLQRLRRRIPVLGLVPSRAGRGVQTSIPGEASSGWGRRRLSVALLTGCGSHVFRPALERAVVRVLEANDVEVRVLASRFCCGALALHEGRDEEARRLASQAFGHAASLEIDFLVTAAAGCRAFLGDVAAGATSAAGIGGAAASGALRVREICELLVEIGFRAPRSTGAASTIAYHDACHLLNAAAVTAPPRAVLAAAGAGVADLGENALCCGSAGTYNLSHEATAKALGRRKAELVSSGGFDRVAVANLGCILQLERALALAGATGVRVAHPIEYLAEAYDGEHSTSQR